MSFVKRGTANSIADFLNQITAWVTDTSIHGSEAWTLMRDRPLPYGIIYKAHGLRPNTHQYIGLMYHEIEKGVTYNRWFFTKPNIATYKIWVTEDEKKDFIFTGNGYSFPGANQPTYTFNDIDIIPYSAKVIHIGVFKHYNEALEWAEQPGGADLNNLEIRPVQITSSKPDNPKTDWVLPSKHGMGYPSLVFDYEKPVPTGKFKYWLIKDASSIIIVVENAKFWQMGYAGMFIPYDSTIREYGSYNFPAVSIGYTSGLTSFGKDVRYRNSQVGPTQVIGSIFDYRVKNWSLTCGLPNYSCKGKDDENSASQVLVSMPDGRWEYFANYVQVVKSKPYHTCRAPITKYHYIRQKPVKPTVKMNFVRPTELDSSDMVHNYDRNNVYDYHMEKLQLVHHEYGIIGEIPRLYNPSKRIYEFGEQELSGKKYLVIPNGWENRKFHLQGYAGLDDSPSYEDVDWLLDDDIERDRRSAPMALIIALEE